MSNARNTRVHIKAEIVGSELRINISLKGEAGLIVIAHSISEDPYYRVSVNDVDSLYSDAVKKKLEDIARSTLFLYGAIGERVLMSQPENKKVKNSLISDADIESILSGVTTLEESDKGSLETRNIFRKGLMIEAYHRLNSIEGGKLIDSDDKTINRLHLSDLDDYDSVVLMDSKIRSLDGIYSEGAIKECEKDPRLQKYLLGRMYVTISGKNHNNKGPLTGKMNLVFREAWDGLSDRNKRGFLECFQNPDSTDIAMDIQIGNQSFFDYIASAWKAARVPIVHVKAKTMTTSEFKNFINKNTELLSLKNEISELVESLEESIA